ncbi:MAG TPA: hypothetical protein VFA67_01345 [Candidatus Sulfotelmatobacter sp.]|nr:hypothetical protein [Candidatus Sulfotelmatobacter sp.]
MADSSAATFYGMAAKELLSRNIRDVDPREWRVMPALTPVLKDGRGDRTDRICQPQLPHFASGSPFGTQRTAIQEAWQVTRW